MFRRLLIALPLAFAGALWFWCLVLPWPVLLRWREPSRTSFMRLRLHQAHRADRDLELRYTYVPLESIAPSLRRAVVLAEDGRFTEHSGIDWAALGEELHYRSDGDFSFLDFRDVTALARSIAYYVGNRDEVRGRSTITQQLAKNLWFSSDRSVMRKVEELVAARRLEWFLSKDRILELYLNVAEFGPGIFGAEAAAQEYYRRPASKLTLDQAVTLAATLPQPLSANPKLRPGRLQWRKDLIYRRIRNTR